MILLAVALSASAPVTEAEVDAKYAQMEALMELSKVPEDMEALRDNIRFNLEVSRTVEQGAKIRRLRDEATYPYKIGIVVALMAGLIIGLYWGRRKQPQR